MTAPAWPPPADEASVWREFTPQGTRDRVRARQVPLWGRLVFVDDDGAVWCPYCLRFLTVEALAKPYNGHAVGLPTPSGTVVRLEEGDDGPGSRYVDPFMRRIWGGGW